MPKIGLVLSGGLAKGAYQLGVLKAINELVRLEDIVAISASSVGTLNAYAFINQRLEAAENIWKTIDCKSMTAFVRHVLQSDFLEKQIDRIATTSNILCNSFYTTLLNTTSRSLSYIDLKKVNPSFLKNYIRASVALPPFNKPISIQQTHYLDGALVDNIPILPLKSEKLDCIICVYFEDYNYNFENVDLNNKTIKINQQSNMFMKNVFLFKHEYIEQMIQDGYVYGKDVLQDFFVNGELLPDYLEPIQEYHQKNSDLKWYVTCEVFTKKLNKVTRKYLDKKRSTR